MASVYYWLAADRPSLGSMTLLSEPNPFDDNSPGDTSSGESATASATAGSCPAVASAIATITAVLDLGSVQVITAYDFTTGLGGYVPPGGAACLFPIPSSITFAGSFALEYSIDGTTWTSFLTGSYAPLVAVSGYTFDREQGTFSGGTTARYIRVVADSDTETAGYPGVSLATRATITDLRITSTAVQIPQCSTRTFTAAPALSMVSGHLWEIQQNGILLDFGDRYDQFGPGGWGILSPGLTGSGSLTVTAPGWAAIGTGYSARTSGASVTFEVIAGTCPGSTPPDYGAIPKMVVFTTGVLYTHLRLVSPALSRVALGAPPVATYPLGNGNDASPATVLDLTYTDSGDRQYLQCDFGAAADVGYVLLRNVTCAGTVHVYSSTTLITTGDFSGATALTSTDTQPATGAPLQFYPASGTVVTGRYIYIVCPTAAMSVGDIDIRGEGQTIASIQQGSLSCSYQEQKLYDVPWRDLYCIADAQYDFTLTLNAETGIFVAKAAELMTGATYANDGTHITLTGGHTDKLIRFNGSFESRTPDGKKLVWTIYEMVAPGINWQFGREAFAKQNFTANLRLSDSTAIPFRIEVDV